MIWKQFLARFMRPTSRQDEPSSRREEPSSIYPKNAPGDFYVAENCCLWCGVPWDEAPEHFEVDDKQCYIKRQPTNEVEVKKMISAMKVQTLDCIRYKGSNQKIITAIYANAGVGLVDG